MNMYVGVKARPPYPTRSADLTPKGEAKRGAVFVEKASWHGAPAWRVRAWWRGA